MVSTDLVAWPIPGGAVLRLFGADASEWLQGQVTQDIRNLSGWKEACLTASTGQLMAHAYLRAEEDGIRIVTGQPHVVRQRVDQLVIMEDVSLETVSDEAWITASLAAQPGFLSVGGIWLAPRDTPRVDLGHCRWRTCEILDDSEVNRWEIRAGIPRIGVDTTEKTLPPELGQAFESRTVSYTKGCYMGQEVLMRIHSRGHTNRTWVCLSSSEPLTAGSLVFSDGVQIGLVHRTTAGPLATATLKNDYAADGIQVTVDGVVATVKNWPL